MADPTPITAFMPLDPNFEARVRSSFAEQKIMVTLGAEIGRVEPGLVEIGLPFRDDLTQQHAFLHAGVVATILDSACGYAAFSLMPPQAEVLTVEYKINLLRPAVGEFFLARGRVVKPGKTLTVTMGEVFARRAAEAEDETLVAAMTATVMRARL